MFLSMPFKAGAGADPSEVRKLNRRIKELEVQLKAAAASGPTILEHRIEEPSKHTFLPGGGSGSNSASAGAGNNASSSGGSGGGGGGGGSEAKLLQRKLKDLETSSKKENKQLEARASKVCHQ